MKKNKRKRITVFITLILLAAMLLLTIIGTTRAYAADESIAPSSVTITLDTPAQATKVSMTMQNTSTKDVYNVNFDINSSWTTTLFMMPGTYEVTSATSDAEYSSIHVEDTFDVVQEKQVNITLVTNQKVSAPSLKHLIKNNILLLLLLVGISVAYFVIKKKSSVVMRNEE